MKNVSSDTTILGYRFYHNIENDQIWYTSPENSMPTLFDDVSRGEFASRAKRHGISLYGGIDHFVARQAAQSTITPIRTAITTPQWDGENHIACLASYVFGSGGIDLRTVEERLTRWLLGAVRRVLEGTPNNVLVLVGEEGIGKTYFTRWLASVGDNLYSQMWLDPRDRDCRLNLAECLIWEINEYDLLSIRRNKSMIRAFFEIAKFEERRPYARRLSSLRGLASFVATLSDVTDTLAADASDTCFLLLPLVSIDWGYATEVDVRQVWAEAVARYRAGETAAS